MVDEMDGKRKRNADKISVGRHEGRRSVERQKVIDGLYCRLEIYFEGIIVCVCVST
jgi:hypothetical protein